MRRLAAHITAAAVLALAAGGTAASAAGAASEPLMLDTYEASNDGFAGPVSTPALVPGAVYMISIDGTYSFWAPRLWTGALCNASSEPHPIHPSPGVPNGRAGVDPEFVFSAPKGVTSNCSANPLHSTALQMDTGTGFRHVEPVGGPAARPTAAHKYTYLVKGAGDPAVFRFQVRDGRTSENYGRLRISLRRVVRCPSEWVAYMEGIESRAFRGRVYAARRTEYRTALATSKAARTASNEQALATAKSRMDSARTRFVAEKAIAAAKRSAWVACAG